MYQFEKGAPKHKKNYFSSNHLSLAEGKEELGFSEYVSLQREDKSNLTRDLLVGCQFLAHA